MIINRTKNKIVSNKFLFVNHVNKIKGQLFKTKAVSLVFNTRFGIHTFLLNFPIDVLVLDSDRKVILAKKSLLPNRVLFWNLRYNLVIELPEGSIDKSKTEINDSIDIKL